MATLMCTCAAALGLESVKVFLAAVANKIYGASEGQGAVVNPYPRVWGSKKEILDPRCFGSICKIVLPTEGGWHFFQNILKNIRKDTGIHEKSIEIG